MPDFLIIGAGKSGTTSVDNYLKQHPEIFISKRKEPNFFGYELNSEEDFAGSPQINHYRLSVTNIDDYQALFSEADSHLKKGETSNTYMYHETAAERIKHYIPEVKLIAILRQPAERLFSRYLHLAREDRLPTANFEDCLNKDTIWWQRNDLVKEGFYGKYLKRYFELFPEKNIKVFLYDELRNNPEKLMRDVFHFLEVDDTIKLDFSIEYNKSGFIKNKKLNKLIGPNGALKKIGKGILPQSFYYKVKNSKVITKKLDDVRTKNLERPKLTQALKKEITNSIYKDDLKLLEQLIGRDLSHWISLD